MAEDMRGREINVGSTVAVAFRDGNGCELRLGEVVEIIERRAWPTYEYFAKVKWTSAKNGMIGTVTRIALRPDRFVVLD